MKRWMAMLMLALLAGPAAAATYYVDSAAGDDNASGQSEKLAWKSLAAVNARAFKPGDTILFKCGGRWTGQLAPQGSGALVNGKPCLITIDRYGEGPLPRIDGEGVLPAAVVLKNTEYITLQNLEITNQGGERKPHRMGVYLHLDDFGTAHEVTLRNLHVHDVNGGLWKKDRGAGIEYKCEGKAKRSRFDGLLIENCRLERCDRNGIMGWGHERRNAWFPSLRVVIRGNTLEDIGGDVIVPIACDGCLIERNVVRDCGGRYPDGDAAAGIWPWGCDNTVIQFNEVSGQRGDVDAQAYDSDYNCRNTLIQYNYSHDNAGGFVLVCNDGSDDPRVSAGNVGTVVRYNVSVNDGWRAQAKRMPYFSPSFHLSGPCRDTRIYNNTVIVGKKASDKLDTKLVAMTDWNGYPRDTFFCNNIFVCEDKLTYDLGKAMNTAFANNLYWGRHVGLPDGAPILKDPLLIKPVFVSVAMKELEIYGVRAGSPAIGAGKVIPQNGGRDFLGNPVPADRPPTIGAFEFCVK